MEQRVTLNNNFDETSQVDNQKLDIGILENNGEVLNTKTPKERIIQISNNTDTVNLDISGVSEITKAQQNFKEERDIKPSKTTNELSGNILEPEKDIKNTFKYKSKTSNQIMTFPEIYSTNVNLEKLDAERIKMRENLIQVDINVENITEKMNEHAKNNSYNHKNNIDIIHFFEMYNNFIDPNQYLMENNALHFNFKSSSEDNKKSDENKNGDVLEVTDVGGNEEDDAANTNMYFVEPGIARDENGNIFIDYEKCTDDTLLKLMTKMVEKLTIESQNNQNTEE
ncbi:hypothetical protein EDEG_00629 [Edhazardia aedis USNM 41457]|uniref:Uncharacterized protein n=1 Tax=Edhazardia aedis (strain USNM 41457) TaxID=1003232 RepID=J9DC58_EDHAE|nr:hypothetical protein EDEG_00629 [Edhazardia aedis USNM 41457]|eukprot:EJW05326.1 hypothetical protein EDEG_00629 [Edhazardia aedis USNM 41457]